MRRRFVLGLSGAMCLTFVLIGAGPALACGGLIGPNGGVSLLKTTTLAGYHDGIEHYVTGFSFTGGTGNFGSIIPLPGVPTKVEKGGNGTLQRLVKEVTPPAPRAGFFDKAEVATAAAPAEVLQQVRVDAPRPHRPERRRNVGGARGRRTTASPCLPTPRHCSTSTPTAPPSSSPPSSTRRLPGPRPA